MFDPNIDVGLQQDTSIDIPIEDPTLAIKTEAVNNLEGIQAAYIDNYNTGKDVIESFTQNSSPIDNTELLAKNAQDKVSIDKQTITDIVAEKVVNGEDTFQELAPAAIAAQTELDNKPVNPDVEFVDSVAKPELPDKDKEALANKITLYKMLEEAGKEFDFGDEALDFTESFFVLPDLIKDKATFGKFFDTDETLTSMISAFKAKPVEEQQKIFPQLAKELLDGLGPMTGAQALINFIEPTTDLGRFDDTFKAIGIAGYPLLAARIASRINTFRKAMNLPKILSEAGNTEAAGKAVAAASVSEDVAKKANLDKTTTFGDSVAFDTSTVDLGHEKGLSTATLNAIDDFFGRADRTAEDIMASDKFLKEGILNSIERAHAEEKAFKKLKEAQHENIRVADRSENSTTFVYDTIDDNGNLVQEEKAFNLTLNDVGFWTQDQLQIFSEFLNSPTVFAKGTTKFDVETAQRLDSQIAKVYRHLSELQAEAVKPLGNLLRPKNRKRLAVVDKALREGDAAIEDGVRGKLWKPDELRGIYGMDQAQMETYYKVNRIYNNLWRLNNNSRREEMIALGLKHIQVNEVETSFGKNFDTPDNAFNSLRSGDVKSILDTTTGAELENVSKKAIERAYEEGKVLVRLEAPHKPIDSEGSFKHILVNAEDVTELPSVVLRRKTAYVPKVSKDGYWFAKELSDIVVDGKLVERGNAKTLRYFDNKAEADAFIEQQVKNAMEKDGLTEVQARAKYKALEDREQEIIATATGSFSNGSGGLYTAARAQDDILFGLNGKEAERINAFEALSRNIARVSRTIPVNQWRLGLEQRWLNTANKLLDTKITKFGELPENINSTRKGEFLNKMAKQIRDWQGFPSRSEQVYSSFNERLYEWALGAQQSDGVIKSASGKVLKNIAGWSRGKDPVSAARAAAFHSLLGWFNPAQLWVQAQGMSVAMSINLGKDLGKSFKDMTGLMMLGEGATNAAHLERVAKALGIPVKELEQAKKLWDKSGLADSILQTADHAASIRGHGIAMTAISKAADKGLFFYRYGEMLNRRMAFVTALNDLKAGRINMFADFKAGAEITDDMLKAVLDRANNLMLNMTKANRANWQKGPLSLTTQFFQPSSKAVETLLGLNGHFTKAERGRILAGQIALYGTAGLPLANLGTNYLLEVMGVTQKEIDENPEIVKAWNDGIWGAITLGMFGVDAEVSSRGSLLRGVTDFVNNWAFSDSTVAAKLLGAFGTTGQRFFDKFTEEMRPIMLGAYPADMIDWVKLPTAPFLNTISTWRNVEKAVFMHNLGEILSSRSDVNVEGEFNTLDKIAQVIGFQQSDEVKTYKLRDRNQHIQSVKKKIVDLVLDRMKEVALREQTIGLSEDYLKATEQFYATMIGSVDYSMQEDIRKSVMRRVLSDSKSTREIRRYLETVYGNRLEGLSTIKDGIIGTSVLQIIKEDK